MTGGAERVSRLEYLIEVEPTPEGCIRLLGAADGTFTVAFIAASRDHDIPGALTDAERRILLVSHPARFTRPLPTPPPGARTRSFCVWGDFAPRRVGPLDDAGVSTPTYAALFTLLDAIVERTAGRFLPSFAGQGLPPRTDAELFRDARTDSLRVDHPSAPRLRALRGASGETLLHHAGGVVGVCALLALGLDPNARDDKGRTPLMARRSAEANRALIEAGADLHAVDAAGERALAHQADVLTVGTGYGCPDLEALQVLIDAGAPLPTPDEAEAWIARTEGSVSHHMEHADWQRFAAWARRLARDRK